MSSDKPIDRRRFFRVGLAELFKPLGKAVHPFEELAKQLGKLEEPPAYRPPPIYRAPDTVARAPYASPVPADSSDDDDTYFIRPPGARAEVEFNSICSRCGNCVHACPVHAIQLDHSGARGGGAPYIDPDVSACVMCDGLYCMTQCPSSALVLTPREQVDIGTAVWNESLCLRTSANEQCSMCVDHCPVGPAALEVIDNRIAVHEEGCTGCGACQNNCPTTPKSITVTPKAQRDR